MKVGFKEAYEEEIKKRLVEKMERDKKKKNKKGAKEKIRKGKNKDIPLCQTCSMDYCGKPKEICIRGKQL